MRFRRSSSIVLELDDVCGLVNSGESSSSDLLSGSVSYHLFSFFRSLSCTFLDHDLRSSSSFWVAVGLEMDSGSSLGNRENLSCFLILLIFV